MKPTSDGKGSYQTSMPEDLREFLLSMSAFSKTDDPLISRFARRLETISVESFINLAREYAARVDEIDLDPLLQDGKGAPDPTQLEERSLWLCSVVNDCTRVLTESLATMRNDEANSSGDASPSRSILTDRVHKAYKQFEQVRKLALDAISCVVFAPCMHVLHDFEQAWRNSAANTETSGPIADVMHLIRDSLHFYRYIIVHNSNYIHLVEICCDKIVMLCLALLRDFSSKFTPAEIEKMGSDITLIKKGFLVCVKGPDSEKNFAVIEIHLKRLQDIYYLVSEAPSSINFINTTRRLVGESECDPLCDSIALSMIVEKCFEVREWEDFEEFKGPLDELVSMLKHHADDKNKVSSRILVDSSPEQRTFRMINLGIENLLTKIVIREDATIIEHNPKLPLWQLNHSNEFGRRRYGPKVKSITVLRLTITDIFGLDAMMLSCAPSVYVSLSTNLTGAVTTSLRTSYNPVWDEPLELQYDSECRLIDSAKLLCRVFFLYRLFGSTDMLYGSVELPIHMSDPTTPQSETVSGYIAINEDSKSCQIAFAKAIKRKAPLPKLHVRFRVDDE